MTTILRVLSLLALAQPAFAQLQLGDTAIVFATVEEGQQLLTQRDDFVSRMSPFDRAARLKTDREVPEKEYLEFVAKNVAEWTDAEKQKLSAAIEGVSKKLETLSLPLPERVLLIKTTGSEEGGAAYTRANGIVFPQGDLGEPPARLQQQFCHELFHVLSRANPVLRDKLYATIGFQKCGEVALPAALAPRKITNPDAPRNAHAIRVRVAGQQQWAVPVLFANQSKYSTKRGGEFFAYLELRFMLIGAGEQPPQTFQANNQQLAGRRQLAGFFDQIGRNTGYIIHPEEVLADNFSFLVIGNQRLRSPEVVKKIEAVLKQRAAE